MNDSDRIRIYIAFNEIPLQTWLSFGDVCQKACMSPRKVRVCLVEAKRQGAFESQSYTTPNGYGSTNWNVMWKRIKEVEMPK